MILGSVVGGMVEWDREGRGVKLGCMVRWVIITSSGGLFLVGIFGRRVEEVLGLFYLEGIVY